MKAEKNSRQSERIAAPPHTRKDATRKKKRRGKRENDLDPEDMNVLQENEKDDYKITASEAREGYRILKKLLKRH